MIIAEIEEATGNKTASKLANEFGPGRAMFVKMDVGDEEDVKRLKQAALAEFGKVDIILNNATIFPMDSVEDVPITAWDKSYHVNLRGPVLLALA